EVIDSVDQIIEWPWLLGAGPPKRDMKRARNAGAIVDTSANRRGVDCRPGAYPTRRNGSRRRIRPKSRDDSRLSSLTGCATRARSDTVAAKASTPRTVRRQ